MKDANTIWKFPENKAIASRRGKPEQLQPGDVLALPPSEKDLKQAQAKAAKTMASVDAELGRTKQKLAAIDKLIAESNANYLAIIKELGATKGRVQSASDTADALAMIASTGKSLATKVTDEIDDQVRTIQSQRNDQLKMLISHRKNIEALSAKLQSERKVVETSMNELH